MKILVVHPGSGWILSSIAELICAAAPDNFIAHPMTKGINLALAEYIEREVDGVYCIDLQNCWMGIWRRFFPDKLHIAMFTHLDKDSNESMRPYWHGVDGPDGIVHMCERYRERFERQGWHPPERMTVLRPGEVLHFPLKKTKIGICQRGEHVGKGRDFLPEVIRSLRPEVRDCIELHFKGKGWDDAFEGKTFRGAVFIGADKPETWFSGFYYGVSAFSYASEDAKSYPAFYERLDYFLVPSTYEGGPMAILEALATGLPIISSEVGWVPEFKRIAHLYPAGCVDALAIILTEIAERRLLRRAEIEGMNYRNYAAGVLAFFEKIKEMRW